MKIAIYGTGNRAHDFIEEIIFLKCNCEVIYFVESKRTK